MVGGWIGFHLPLSFQRMFLKRSPLNVYKGCQNLKKKLQNTHKFDRLHIIVKIRNNCSTSKYILYTNGISFGRLIIQSFSETKPSSL